MVISGPIATWSFCGLVALGVIIAIGVCILSKVKKIRRADRTKWLMVAVACILAGLFLLWFV